MWVAFGCSEVPADSTAHFRTSGETRRHGPLIPPSPPTQDLPAGVGSTSEARECRVALREGAGGPVRKEEVVALSGGQWDQGPTSFLSLFPTTRPTQGKETYDADGQRSLQRSQSCSPGRGSKQGTLSAQSQHTVGTEPLPERPHGWAWM